MVLGIAVESTVVDILPFLLYKNSNFSTSSPAPVIFYFFFNDGSPNWCDFIPHCGIDLNFLMISNTEHLYICLLVLDIFFGDMCPLLVGIFSILI